VTVCPECCLWLLSFHEIFDHVIACRKMSIKYCSNLPNADSFERFAQFFTSS
jgi:hypothetical protein